MNTLTVNGTALAGIYIDASQSFNKPEKRSETFAIPGRSGDLLIDEQTFANVVIAYPCYERGTFPAAFNSIVNELSAIKGYMRVQCSNDPTHYRLGRFLVPQTPTVKRVGNKDGYFNLSWDCKPQRFLISGDEPVEFTAEGQEEVYGPASIASFEAEEGAEIRELKVNLEPVQSGTGDPSPTNIRPITGFSEVNVTRAGKNLFDEVCEKGLINPSTGADVANNGLYRSKNYIKVAPNTTYYVLNSAHAVANNASIRLCFYDKNKTFIESPTGSAISRAFTTPNNAYYVRFFVNDNMAYYASDISVNYPSTATTYEPYAGQTYPISLGQTVYGGTLNVSTGVLTVDRAIMEVTSASSIAKDADSRGYHRFYLQNDNIKKLPRYTESLIANACGTVPNYASFEGYSGTIAVTGYHITSSPYNYLYLISDSISTVADMKTWLETTPLQVVYPLATPTTVQLTATQVSTLLGQNNIFADAGEVEVQVASPVDLTNPTNFPAKPLIRVYGNGSVRVGDTIATVQNNADGYMDIDCELMDCFRGTTNLNADVTFSGNDFPVLNAGSNNITLGSGITQAIITPRWWEL